MKWLHRLIISFIGKYIPRKGKRMLFILICYCIWTKHKDERVIRDQMIEINNKLRLSNDSEALNFAIGLRSILLNMDDIKPLQEIDPKDIPSTISKKMPDWIKYDSLESINRDLQMVFKSRYVTNGII